MTVAVRGARLPAPSAERWQRLERVLDGALDLPVADRAAFIARACDGDAVLHEEATAWLRGCDRDELFLQDSAHTGEIAAALRLDDPRSAGSAGRPTPGDGSDDSEGSDDSDGGDTAPRRPGSARLGGTCVGAWRLIREVGRGGMGTVYLAERAETDVPIRAALKFMRGIEAVDPLALRRFRDERRILATLDHPAIARLLDAGIDDGVPWFAMEYVAGLPIDAWCKERRLTIPERVRLLSRVCDAVQHAHGRLIVHRDLKPANILVSEAGDPRLLDFGIAKLLAPGGEADTAHTSPGFQPMTLAYAAPEQVRGDPPTTATDVYALGVLLEAVLSDVCATAPRTAGRSRALDGDLRMIVARATHPDPGMRYLTANALASDLRRHLEGRPVHARPDTLAYRLRKLVQRNPGAAAIATGAAIMIVGAAIVNAVQARELRTQAAVLVAERDKSAEVTAFLAGVLASADPYVDGRVPTLRDVLDRGAERAAVSLRDRPDVRAHLLSAMAPAYFGLGDWERAGSLAQEAVELRRQALDPADPALAGALVYLANVRLNQGRAAEAEAQAREALAIHRAAGEGSTLDSLRIMSTLGAALQRRGRLAEAESILRALVAAERAREPVRAVQVAQVSRNLAHVLRDQRRFSEAVPLYAEAYVLHRHAFGDAHPEAANSAINLGNALMLWGDARAALPLLRAGVEAKRRLLGVEHRDVAGDQLTLAAALTATGADAEAKAVRAEALAVLERTRP